MQYFKIINVQVSVFYPIFFERYCFSFPFFSRLCSMQQMAKFLRFGIKTHVYTFVIYAYRGNMEHKRTCTYVRVPKPACGYFSSLFAATSFNYPGQPEVDVIYAL